jgi:hypothetical protein
MPRKAKVQEAPDETRSNGHVTTADFNVLREMVESLARGQQELVKLLAPESAEEEFAPDDADLREEAEKDAVALTAPGSGVTISGLGKDDDKKSKASEMLVGAMFNTPKGKLDEMTDIRSSLEAAAFAGVRTINEFVMGAFNRKPGEPPVMMSDLFLDNLFKLNRSIGGKHMMRAMAMSQIEKEREEAKENAIIFGGGGSD